MDGFIKLNRKLRDWQWYGTPNMVAVWIELLLRANYEDGYFKGVLIKKGSAVIGRKELAKKLGLTEQQVRTCIERLKSTNEITTKTTNRYTVVNIVKWEEYQSYIEVYNQQNNQYVNQQITNKQPTDNQQITTSKKYKNTKNNNIYINKYGESENLYEKSMDEIKDILEGDECNDYY